MTQAEERVPGGSRFGSFGRKVDAQFGEFGPRIEDEVRKVVAYLNDEVVPQVRRESSSALRTAAEQLGRLAEHLERGRGAAPVGKREGQE